MLTTAGPAALTAELKLSFCELSCSVNNVSGRPLPLRKSGTSNNMIEEMITPIRMDFKKKYKNFSTRDIKYFLHLIL
jgi:hypothetical protein